MEAATQAYFLERARHMPEELMTTEVRQYTLGQLISDLEGSEQAYEENLRTADGVEAKDGHNLVSTWWRIQAAALLFQPDPTQHPGIDLIEALCDEWGTGLKADNVRKVRGKVCSKLGVGVTEANAITLKMVATVLGLAATGNKIDHRASPPVEDLPAYTIEEQPWWAPLPETRDVSSDELVSLAGEIDIVIMTAAEPELQSALRLVEPYPRRQAILKGFVEQETYYLGRFGSCLAAITKCRMGSLDSGAATLATQHAQRIWQPKAVVMVGIPLGKDPVKQKIADVLVASQVISYEPQRVGEEQVVSRGPITPADTTLLNRFENVPHWSFLRPDRSKCERHVGPLLSGEKLVDDPAFKAELFRRYPQAIGGEMEGVGLAAVAVRHGVPWIVVKSIGDWADGNKHKRHQALAAASAASLVHHVLSQADVLHGLRKLNQSAKDSPKQPPQGAADPTAGLRSATSKNVEPTVLSDFEFSILVVVGQRDRITVREVASTVQVSEQKAKYYLDELAQRHELVNWFGNMNRGGKDHYSLTHAGRRMLVERNVF